jgi:hypothetical protein
MNTNYFVIKIKNNFNNYNNYFINEKYFLSFQ